MNNYQEKIGLFSINTVSPKEWQLNADLDVELQAKPIETDNLDLLLSPLTKVSNQAKFFLDYEKRSHVSQLSILGNNMMAYFNLKKFLQKLSRNRENFKKLTSKHLDVINDQASDQTVLLNSNKNKPKLKIFDFPVLLSQLSKKNSLLTTWKRSILEDLNKIPLIHPESKQKLIWDYFMTALRIVLMILLPLEIAFQPGIVFEKAQIFTSVTILLTILDMIVRLNTVYYEDGKAINDRWKIFELKIQDCIIFDVIAIFSLTVNFGVVLRSILPSYSLQFKYVYEVINKSQESSYLSKPIQGLMKLIWFILTLLTILHIFSCIWFLISQNTYGDNWVKNKEIDESEWATQYIEALYFSTVTMLTIGYGDSVPQNQIEKLVSILFILIACLWYSYAVNTIGQIINELTYNSEKRRQRIRVINGYMNKRKVPYSLQFKIREYLNYRWKEEQESDITQEDKLINELSNELKQELELLGRKNFIEKSQLLQHFSNEFKRSVSSHIKRVIIQPHNTFSMKEDPCLCYLESGQLQFLMTEIKEGQFIQEYEYATDTQTSIPYKAIGYVSLLIIQKDIFNKILKAHQIDHEKFSQLKLKLSSEQYGYLYECKWCSTHGHSTNYCPLVSYKYDREGIIKKHCFPKQNDRVFIIRNRVRNYFKSLSEMELIQEYVAYFQSEKQQIIQDQLKKQLSDSQVNMQIQRKQSIFEDEFQEFGIKRKSIHENNGRSPIQKLGNSNIGQSNFQFLGVIKPKQSELEKSFMLKTIQPNMIEEEQIQNINALYLKSKKDGYMNQDLEMLYLKYNCLPVKDFDHIKSFQHYFPEFNVEQVIKKKREVYKSYFKELIRYMLYPFLYVMKFNKIAHKRKLTGNFQQVGNIMKFKKALLNKKRRQTSVFPNGQPLIQI
ncbi:unnamed protein product [Paramecium pentaurelia]|uniref:Ion transport domain-containing protein n=1 Tax=Paramecium pentaurelia TaxID=43138 RepID=A0A8S1TA11_9CILI|nr:unnamed protein product [Paramecium pentaurelia]